jgi:hypothetical protein
MSGVLTINSKDNLTATELRSQMVNPMDDRIVYEIDQLKPNHHLFEIDAREGGFIQPAEVIKTNVHLMRNGVKKCIQEIKRKPNCIYMPSLNAQNAERKFKRLFGLK